jgi:hypothetical protein
MIYYGIFDDGNCINKHKLEDLAQVTGLEYFLKQEYLPGNKYDVFTLIHPDGKLNFLRINHIELRNIGINSWSNHNKKTMAEFTFYNYRLNKTFQTPLSTHSGAKFVKEELIPFMQGYENNIIQLVPNAG